MVSHEPEGLKSDSKALLIQESDLIRDVFRPFGKPASLRQCWNRPMIVGLAQAI